MNEINAAVAQRDATSYGTIHAGNYAAQHNGSHYGNTTNNYQNHHHTPYHMESIVQQYSMARTILDAAHAKGEDEYHRKEILDYVDTMDRGRLPTSVTKYRHEWSGRTALHYAAAKGWFNEVRALLKAGWEVDAISTKRETPVYRAAYDGYPDVVELLLLGNTEARARLYVPQARSPFVAAVYGGSQQCLEVLLKTWKARPAGEAREESYIGMAAAIRLAAFLGPKSTGRPHPVSVVSLVEILRSPAARNSTKTRKKQDDLLNKAIFYAAQSGHLEVFESLLLDNIADVNTAKRCFNSRSTHTVLHEAAEHSHLDIVRSLLRNERLDRTLHRDLDEKTILDTAYFDVRAELEGAVPGLTKAKERSVARKSADFCKAMSFISSRRDADKLEEKLLMQGFGPYPVKIGDDYLVVRYIQWGAVAFGLSVADKIPFAITKDKRRRNKQASAKKKSDSAKAPAAAVWL